MNVCVYVCVCVCVRVCVLSLSVSAYASLHFEYLAVTWVTRNRASELVQQQPMPLSRNSSANTLARGACARTVTKSADSPRAVIAAALRQMAERVACSPCCRGFVPIAITRRRGSLPVKHQYFATKYITNFCGDSVGNTKVFASVLAQHSWSCLTSCTRGSWPCASSFTTLVSVAVLM